MAGRRKGKNPRKRSKKVHDRKQKKSAKYKSSGWKLKFPDIFKEISYYPFIVRRDDERFKNDW